MEHKLWRPGRTGSKIDHCRLIRWSPLTFKGRGFVTLLYVIMPAVPLAYYYKQGHVACSGRGKGIYRIFHLTGILIRRDDSLYSSCGKPVFDVLCRKKGCCRNGDSTDSHESKHQFPPLWDIG